MEQKAEFSPKQNYRFYSDWVEKLSNGYKAMLDFQDKFTKHGIDPLSAVEYFIRKHATDITGSVYELMIHLKDQSNRFYELLSDDEIDDLTKDCYD